MKLIMGVGVGVGGWGGGGGPGVDMLLSAMRDVWCWNKLCGVAI